MRYIRAIHHWIQSNGALLLGILFIQFTLAACIHAQERESFRTNGKLLTPKDFDQRILKMMKEVRVPGMSLAIIENDQIAYYQTYGLKKRREKEKVAHNTVFSGASLSKSFFVMLVYQLVEDGMLDLDKPMYEYLEHPRLEYDSSYKLITPRMALSHSSGLENWRSNYNPLVLEILNQPGKRQFLYSGEGYNYLSQIVEKLLGQSYEEYMIERVLKPLGLTNTYLRYIEAEDDTTKPPMPVNYAMGHTVNGDYEDYINFNTIPSSGIHFTAEDFAKLIIGIFNGSTLTNKSIKDLKDPITYIDKHFFYGPGFELICSESDTIIAQGGDNDGYKNWVFYSIPHKRGIVFLTNSDKGELMTKQINEWTAELNLTPFFNAWYSFLDQYPGPSYELLNTYHDKGEGKMHEALKVLEKDGKLSIETLNTLCTLLYKAGEEALAERILEKCIRLHPQSGIAYNRIADMLNNQGKVDEALTAFEQARSLGYSGWDLDFVEKLCKQKAADIQRRKSLLTSLSTATSSQIEAEDYNAVDGTIYPVPNSASEAGKKLAFFSNGDLLTYHIDVQQAADYEISVRVATDYSKQKNVLYFQIDGKTLTELEIPLTGGWGSYKEYGVPISLPKGKHKLELFLETGDLNFNWIKLSPLPKN